AFRVQQGSPPDENLRAVDGDALCFHPPGDGVVGRAEPEVEQSPRPGRRLDVKQRCEKKGNGRKAERAQDEGGPPQVTGQRRKRLWRNGSHFRRTLRRRSEARTGSTGSRRSWARGRRRRRRCIRCFSCSPPPAAAERREAGRPG